MIELVGWIGAVAFALSGAPQAWKSIKQGHSRGVAHGLIWLWLTGEACCLVYVAGTSASLPLLVNYAANLVLVGIVAWYRYRPR